MQTLNLRGAGVWTRGGASMSSSIETTTILNVSEAKPAQTAEPVTSHGAKSGLVGFMHRHTRLALRTPATETARKTMHPTDVKLLHTTSRSVSLHEGPKTPVSTTPSTITAPAAACCGESGSRSTSQPRWANAIEKTTVRHEMGATYERGAHAYTLPSQGGQSKRWRETRV